MRPLEILICILLSGSVWIVIRSQIRSEHTMRILFLAVLLCLFHLSFEGYRWQMIPAFGLLGYLFLRTKLRNRLQMQFLGKTFLVLWAIGSILLPIAIPVPALPVPSGPYKVGTQIFQWTDSTRQEWFTDEDPNDVRKLVVQVWYPAVENGEKTAPYMDQMKLRAEMLGNAGGVSGFLVEQLGLVKTHGLLNAKPIVDGNPFPVVLFSHGITGQRALHTILFEHLASNGYFIAALDHPYDCNLTLFPDGTMANYRSDITGHPDSASVRRMQINTRVADIRFVADQLQSAEIGAEGLFGKVHTKSIAVVGYSYGGATAIQSTFEDERFKACIALDGWMNPLPNHVVQNGIPAPFLHLSRPIWENNPLTHLRLDSLVSKGSKHQFSYIVEGTEHLDFTDTPMLNPLSDYVLGTGPIAAGRIKNIINELVLSFLNQYLRKSDEKFLESVSRINELHNKQSHL